jgi:hypothetical protein
MRKFVVIKKYNEDEIFVTVKKLVYLPPPGYILETSSSSRIGTKFIQADNWFQINVFNENWHFNTDDNIKEIFE